MSRLELVGTAQKLARPTKKQLELPTWDNAYLEWIDLSELTVPPMLDADCISYKATGTTFRNTDYTQFRHSIDTTGAAFTADLSSWNHDHVVEVIRQSSNVNDPAVQLVLDHVAMSYQHSWASAIWHLVNDLGMTMDDVWHVFRVTFYGYHRLLARLHYHTAGEFYGLEPPYVPTDLEHVRFQVPGGEREIDLSSHFVAVRPDRHALRAAVRTALVSTHPDAPNNDAWLAQMDPAVILFVRGEAPPDPDWWRGRWGP